MKPHRETFHRQIFDRLGQDICAGLYGPGDALPPEAVLCEQFGVSRIVVREVVKSLAAIGVLDVRQGAGTVVQQPEHWHLFNTDIVTWRAKTAGLDEVFVGDLMELRRVVEPAAARFAALRATDADIHAMRSALEAMEKAIGGEGDYVPADLAFHGAILAACHNQFLHQMQSALSVILHTSFKLSTRVPGGPARSLPLHKALADAIAARDPDAAEAGTIALIVRAESDLLRAIAEMMD